MNNPPPPTTTSRRGFLRHATWLGAGCALQPILSATATASDDLLTVSVIHTTDLHGHILPTQNYNGVGGLGGFARCATLIRRWREQNPHSILIDVGDLYQGTPVSHRSGGEVMIRLLNQFRYDGWVLGNHDFDWGPEALQQVLAKSQTPVLGSNLRFDGGKLASALPQSLPYAAIKPYFVQTIADFKIAVIGSTTPGLSSWLRPETLGGISCVDPVREVATQAKRLKEEEKVDAVIVAGHMGFKKGGDDFANRVETLLEEVKEVDVFIAGHTHRDIPSARVSRTLYTQAGYHGIQMGRVDLTFTKSDRKLIDKRAHTVLMSSVFEQDPVVLRLTADDVGASAKELAKKVITIPEELSTDAPPGTPSPVEQLIADGITHGLRGRGIQVSGVMHGVFSRDPIPKGDLTAGDIWKIMPYENYVVTAELRPADLRSIMEEIHNQPKHHRSLMGFRYVVKKVNGRYQVSQLTDAKGVPLDEAKRYRIALNSYDSQSAGQAFPLTYRILSAPECQNTLHPLETRDALMEYLLETATR